MQHWERLVGFAHKHKADRLVFWGDYSTAKFLAPFLFPRHPGWLTDEDKAVRDPIRRKMTDAAQLTQQSGLDVG